MKNKGVLFASLTVVTLAVLNVIIRFCILEFNINVIVFTIFMICTSGISLMLIRKKTTPEKWKSGVRYSWLYTIMQIILSFTLISSLVYITSTENSLLFNIQIIIAYILAYTIFKRVPYKWDYVGILFVLFGFIFFIFTLPANIRLIVFILILISATASSIRSIVIEKSTANNPETTLREKCGMSGYTLFLGGLCLIIFFYATAILRYSLNDTLPDSLSFIYAFPTLKEMLSQETIITACLTGLFFKASAVYLLYAALRETTSEIFMTLKAFQALITYFLEIIVALFYVGIHPDLSKQDYLFGVIIIVGSLLILIIPKKRATNKSSVTK